MTDASPAADWYPDPHEASRERYWDGTQWTQQYRSASHTEAAAVSAPQLGQVASAPTGSYPAAAGAAAATGASATGSHAHSGQATFIRSLFDLSFAAERSVTTGFVKVLYVIGIALAILGWLGGTILLFVISGIINSISYNDNGNIFILFGVGSLIFGWIPGVINVILLRVGLEFVTAQIRTSQHTAELVRMERANNAQ